MDFSPRLNETNLTATHPTINETNQTKFDMWSLQTARSIHIYYTPLLIFFGIIGNFVSMFVFYVSKLRLQSTSQYLSALALSDTLFLLQLLVPWLGDMAVTGLFHRRGFCQLMVYISYVACCMSAWLVVAFTIERFVAVLYPLRRNSMCTVSRARHIIAGIVICALLANAPVLQFATTIDGMCDIDRDYLAHAARFNISDTVLSFTIPLAVIIVLNTSIIVGVCKLERARQQMVKAERPAMPARTRTTRLIGCPRSQYKVTRMLLIVSSVFVVLNLPAYTMRILAYAFDMNLEEFGGRWFALQQLSTMLFHTNFGINFLLYCLSGQNFRQALYNTTPWVRRRARRGIAVQHATVLQQGRAGSVSSTSAFYASNGTEGGNALLRQNTRRRREENYITRWIFDNSRQRQVNQTMPSTSMSLNTEALEMRVFNPATRVRSQSRSHIICTTKF